MQNCLRCNKPFTVTSWTRNRFWRSVCPKCIVEMLDQVLANGGDEAKRLGAPA